MLNFPSINTLKPELWKHNWTKQFRNLFPYIKVYKCCANHVFLREKVAKLTHLSERPPKRTWSPPQLRWGPSSHAARSPLALRAGFGTFLTIPGPPLQARYNIRPPISGPPPPHSKPSHIKPPISGPLPYQAPHTRPPFPYQTLHPRPTILSPDDQYEAPC